MEERLDALTPGPGAAQVLEDVLREALEAGDAYVAGRALFMQQKDAEALQQFEQAPDTGKRHFYQGLVLRYMGRGAEAVAHLQQATNRSPEVGKYWAALANAVMAEGGRANEAIEAYQQAVKLDPSFRSLSQLGAALLQEGRKEEGADALQQALDQVAEDDLGEEHLTALYNLGVTRAGAQQWDVALKLFQQGEAIEPRDSVIVAKVVQCHAALGHEEEVEAAILRLRKLKAQGLVRGDKFCREQVHTDEGVVLCYEAFEFSGAFKAPYFLTQYEGGAKGNLQYCSMGSYDQTNAMHEGEGRLWHFDAYLANGHATLQMRAGERPTWAEAKPILLDAMKSHR